MDQQQLVNTQFGYMAQNYLTSPVHAQGADLEKLSGLVSQLHPSRILDIGCGAGHASFAMAAKGAISVVAYDLSRPMLEIVAKEARTRKLDQITTQQGPVEQLPFSDASFDLVVTRFSAHHWLGINKALTEIARVSAPGSTFVVIDVVAPEIPLHDTVLQAVELLRDTSHVRDYRISEWKRMLSESGFTIAHCAQWKLPMEFSSWVTRIGTAPGRVEALHAVFSQLPQEAIDYFALTQDHSFEIDSAWIQSSRL